MDTKIRKVKALGQTAPTSTGPAGDPRELLIEQVTGLNPKLKYHPDYLLMWFAGIDLPETTSDQPVPYRDALRRHLLARAKVPAEPKTEAQQQVGDLLTKWSLPAGAIAEALSVTRQTIYLWRAGEQPKPINADRLRELHRKVAQTCGSKTGKDARRLMTKPSLLSRTTRLQDIGRQIDSEHPLPQPTFTALHYLSGTDVDLPVVARKPTVRIAKARPIKSVRSTK